MKHKIHAIILTLLCTTTLFGCQKNNASSQSEVRCGETPADKSIENTTLPIYNAQNEEIGSIETYTPPLLVNNGILYAKGLEEHRISNYDPVEKLEYRLYDAETKEEHILGTIDDLSYDASYETTSVGDHLYMSVSTGGNERENRKQKIYDVDLKNYGMSPIIEVESGLPYNSFTIADNTLYLAELLENGATDIIKYDLTEKRDEAPVVHAYDEQSFFTKDSIRHISADGDHIYMIRLHKEDGDNISPDSLSPFDVPPAMNGTGETTNSDTDRHSLYMDTYDLDLKLLKTTNIGEICNLYEQDELSNENERRQWISDFFVRDAYMLYHNFNSTTFLGTADDDKINRLMETDNDFNCVSDTSPRGDDLFLRTDCEYSENRPEKPQRNRFYLADPKTGAIKQTEFYADETKYVFRSASRNGYGKILLTMGFTPKLADDEPLPDRLYLLDMNDLKFTPYSET